MPELDPALLKRVSGPSWVALKPTVAAMGATLLSASRSARSQLTTIYAKFERENGSVFAVMWVRSSAEGVVTGLALPPDAKHPRLHEAPEGKKYPGLTKYFTVKSGESIPAELASWAKLAFDATAERR